jgi:hypothetical protein
VGEIDDRARRIVGVVQQRPGRRLVPAPIEPLVERAQHRLRLGAHHLACEERHDQLGAADRHPRLRPRIEERARPQVVDESLIDKFFVLRVERRLEQRVDRLAGVRRLPGRHAVVLEEAPGERRALDAGEDRVA